MAVLGRSRSGAPPNQILDPPLPLQKLFWLRQYAMVVDLFIYIYMPGSH